MNSLTTCHHDSEDPESAFDDHFEHLFRRYPDAEVIQAISRKGEPGYYTITTEFE